MTSPVVHATVKSLGAEPPSPSTASELHSAVSKAAAEAFHTPDSFHSPVLGPNSEPHSAPPVLDPNGKGPQKKEKKRPQPIVIDSRRAQAGSLSADSIAPEINRAKAKDDLDLNVGFNRSRALTDSAHLEVGFQPSQGNPQQPVNPNNQVVMNPVNGVEARAERIVVHDLSFTETYSGRRSDGTVYVFSRTITEKDLTEVLGPMAQQQIGDLKEAQVQLIHDLKTKYPNKSVTNIDFRNGFVQFDDQSSEAIEETAEVVKLYRSLYEKYKRSDPNNKGATPPQWPRTNAHSTGNEVGRPTMTLATARSQQIAHWSFDEFFSNPVVDKKFKSLDLASRKKVLQKVWLAEQYLTSSKKMVTDRLQAERTQLRGLQKGSDQALALAQQITALEQMEQKLKLEDFNRFSLYFGFLYDEGPQTSLGDSVIHAEDRLHDLAEIYKATEPPDYSPSMVTRVKQVFSKEEKEYPLTVQESQLNLDQATIGAENRLERMALNRALGVSIGRDSLEAGLFRAVRKAVDNYAAFNADALLNHPQLDNSALSADSKTAFETFTHAFFEEASRFLPTTDANFQVGAKGQACMSKQALDQHFNSVIHNNYNNLFK